MGTASTMAFAVGFEEPVSRERARAKSEAPPAITATATADPKDLAVLGAVALYNRREWVLIGREKG